MKKKLVIILLLAFFQLNNGIAKNSMPNVKTVFAANLIGYFNYSGTEYAVWAYIPDNSIAKISWQAGTPPNTYFSPNCVGFWYEDPNNNNRLSANVNFVDINGNNATYKGGLHQ